MPRDVAPCLKPLEERCLLSNVTWDGGGDGVHWSDANNWSANALPTADDDVTINFDSNTVQHDAGTDTVNSLTTANKLTLSGGTLAMNGGTVQNNGTFTVNSDGTLESYGTGGTNLFANAGTFTKHGTGLTRFFVNIAGAELAFNNSGTVNVQAGTWRWETGGTLSHATCQAASTTGTLTTIAAFVTFADHRDCSDSNIRGEIMTLTLSLPNDVERSLSQVARRLGLTRR